MHLWQKKALQAARSKERWTQVPEPDFQMDVPGGETRARTGSEWLSMIAAGIFGALAVFALVQARKLSALVHQGQ